MAVNATVFVVERGIFQAHWRVLKSRERPKAIERIKLQPGFRDTVEGFTIDPYTLDEDHWAEGYVTVKHRTDDETLRQNPETR